MLHLSLLASTGFLQGPVAPLSQTVRADVQMFVGGEQANPRENFKTKATPSLIKTGKAPAKSKSKRAISTKSTTSTFIDVTGRKYQEVDTFVPQFDEVGVLPPLGRWDPLQIREQVRTSAPSRSLRTAAYADSACYRTAATLRPPWSGPWRCCVRVRCAHCELASSSVL